MTSIYLQKNGEPVLVMAANIVSIGIDDGKILVHDVTGKETVYEGFSPESDGDSFNFLRKMHDKIEKQKP